MRPDGSSLWPNQAWLWVKANGHLAINGVGALLLALASLSTWMLAGGAILSVAGLAWGLYAAPKVHELQQREALARRRAQDRTDGLKDIMRLVLHEIATQMSLDLSHTRLSVYTHGHSSFSMVQRYSENPVLTAPSRTTYPDSEGLIGEVWSSGHCQLVTRLPKDREKWNQNCVDKWHIPHATASAMSMHSRSMLGRRIDTQGRHREPLGVVILESLEPTGLAGEHRDQLEAFSGVLLEVLALIMPKMDEHDGLSAPRHAEPQRAIGG